MGTESIDKELIKYWTLQRYLNYCFKHCKATSLGYNEDGSYNPEILLENLSLGKHEVSCEDSVKDGPVEVCRKC